MCRSSLYGNREILGFGRCSTAGPHREGEEPKPMMNEPRKSDPAIVAGKPTNEAALRAAEESAEPRAGAKGNAGQQSTDRTQCRIRVSQALERVRKAARARKKERFTALLHHVNIDLLRLSFYALKRTAAPGVDGVTWQDYERDLEGNLRDLHARVHRGAYRAMPSRRRYIPKADGRQRPLGIASLEDKLLQGAVVAVLNAIYEEDFLGFSYGFRPGRGSEAGFVEQSMARMKLVKSAKFIRGWSSRHSELSMPWFCKYRNLGS
jgi:RNA-directed DNA polymerase